MQPIVQLQQQLIVELVAADVAIVQPIVQLQQLIHVVEPVAADVARMDASPPCPSTSDVLSTPQGSPSTDHPVALTSTHSFGTCMTSEGRELVQLIVPLG